MLKSEELLLFLGAMYLFTQLSFSWWVFVVLLLVPDISMLGYFHSNKWGARLYNLIHHRGLAVVVLVGGYEVANEWLLLSGVILFAHTTLDRVWGYGLKYEDAFEHTHLGMIKRSKA